MSFRYRKKCAQSAFLFTESEVREVLMIYPELLRRLCCASDLLHDCDENPMPVNQLARRTGFCYFHP